VKHPLFPRTVLLHAFVMGVGISTSSVSILSATGPARADGAQVKGELATAPAVHCTWGDFGCTNPPPLTGAGSTPAALACDKDLSTPSECWTNCKTEDEITICDIINLDTFWPESPQTKPTKFTGETVKKTVHDRPFVGRVMTAAR